MILSRELGGYGNNIIRLNGSFRINGTSDPDVIRDGKSKFVSSVVRVSAGLFTVTLASGFPIPERLVSWKVDIAQTASPTAFVKPHMVVDSYSQSTRSFQVQCYDFATPSATDPDDNDMISFELVGAISSAGTDAA